MTEAKVPVSTNITNILGVRINIIDMEHALQTIERCIGKDYCHHVVTANAEMVIRVQEDETLKENVSKADLVVADGAGILWAARVFGVSLPCRIPGIELMGHLLEIAARKNYSVFLFGAAEGMAEQAGNKMAEKFPGLRIVGTQHGFVSPSDTESVIAKINDSGADLLFVATGAPRQEKWIAANRTRLRCSVAIGVGGSFDVYAGITRRAPRWMGELGLEWLFRLLQEPRRFRRMLALPQFVYRVLLEKWTGGYRRS